MSTIYINGQPKVVPFSSLPVAKVERPLRYLKAKCIRYSTSAKGEITTYFTKPYPTALEFSKQGVGFVVQYLARNFIQPKGK